MEFESITHSTESYDFELEMKLRIFLANNYSFTQYDYDRKLGIQFREVWYYFGAWYYDMYGEFHYPQWKVANCLRNHELNGDILIGWARKRLEN